MEKRSITINYQSYDSIEELSQIERDCVVKSEAIVDGAHAPYSEFKVSSVVLFEDGTLHVGTNQENAAYPSGLCAERVAVFGAKANFPNKHIQSVFIYTKKHNDKPFSPCGACRQSILEYEQQQSSPISVYMKSGNSSIYRFDSIKDLMPLSFDGNEAFKKS